MESFKKFELFLNSLKKLVIFAVLSGYIVKTFLFYLHRRNP
nr:MAG TPA: hypothetical protein [Caudoviricetes sp.]